MDHLCYLCLVFVMLSRLFIAALWSPAGKGLISWLSFAMFNCVFATLPCGILNQVWYLILSIPGLCHLSYFVIAISEEICVGHCLKCMHAFTGYDTACAFLAREKQRL